MSPIHIVQFILFSVGIFLFSIFTNFVFYYDFLSSKLYKDIKTEYDYIIVGSGTAGSLIAQRIAQETNYTFIVLEAGGKGHPFHDVPVFGPLLHQSIFDWNYVTEPQEHACHAMEESRCKQTQGKIFGGSSKLNNMIHVRGNLSHYVQWFHNKYTKEYIESQFDYIESNIINLDSIQYHSQFSDAILGAAKELNYKVLGKDFDIGFKKSTVWQKSGKRWTVSHNLAPKHVCTNTVVVKLLFDKNKCIGVQTNTQKDIFAKRGIIISAGTFNSPKILQLSGIGPKDLLNSLEIPIIKDLPVGQNLQDHIGTGLDLVLFNNSQSVDMLDVMNLWNVCQYFFYGKGPLTTPGCEAVGFISTKNTTTPDLQYMVLPVGISADRGSHLRKVLKIKNDVWEKYFEKIFDSFSATFLALLLHPKSNGEIRIQSKDPNVPPIINPKYLSHKDDLKVLIEGVKMIKKFIETNSLKDIGARLNNIPFPGCDHIDFFSDPYLECYIRQLTLTSFHPIGTCAMGSVVDSSFRVLGIDKLFVVDGSVLPTLPSANINAAIAMMANIFFESTIRTFSKQNICDGTSFEEFVLKICSYRH